jgi:coiled-coil domain-containing protein 41
VFYSSILDLKAQLDILKHTIDQQGELLVDKERELVKRVQAAREEEWQKLHAIESEK